MKCVFNFDFIEELYSAIDIVEKKGGVSWAFSRQLNAYEVQCVKKFGFSHEYYRDEVSLIRLYKNEFEKTKDPILVFNKENLENLLDKIEVVKVRYVQLNLEMKKYGFDLFESPIDYIFNEYEKIFIKIITDSFDYKYFGDDCPVKDLFDGLGFHNMNESKEVLYQFLQSKRVNP
jgi:hypothetical protein